MRAFTPTELANMQGVQVSAMMDTCIVQAYSRTLSSKGSPVETWADGSAIVCGLEMTAGRESRRANMTVNPYDATIRLPIGTAIKATDKVKVTHRFGVALTIPMVFDVVGEVRRGPSGLQVDLQWVMP